MMDERVEKLKRYITRCTALLLILVMTLLTACGNRADVDSAETSETAELTENVESGKESIGNYGGKRKENPVDITYEVTETQEEAVKDSEKVEANYDINLSPAEVYELFLNGELTVAQKVYIRCAENDPKEEQVTIDELFWGNDIEYCFLDIDGDGSEELHIRDDVMYYAVKAMMAARKAMESIIGVTRIRMELWTKKTTLEYISAIGR